MEMLADRHWTYEDYCQLPDDGRRYEVLEGRLYVTPAPVTLHQWMTGCVRRALEVVQDAGLGWVFASPIDVLLPGASPVQPDLVFVGADQAHILKPQNIQGVPKLVVEVLSPSTMRHDRVTKLNLFARGGVPHYWLLDPAARTLELFELDRGTYRLVRALGPGDRHEPRDFPGLLLDVDGLFANVPPGIE